MEKINAVLLSIIMFFGLAARLGAGDLSLLPDIKLKRGSNSGEEVSANLRVYLKNSADKLVVLPTRGFSSIVSIQSDRVSVVLLFQADETVKGMRVVRPIAAFQPVEIRKDEMTEAEFNFIWPSSVERKYPVTVTFEIDPVTAQKYNFWSGSISAQCEVLLRAESNSGNH